MPKAQFDRIMDTMKKAEEIIESRGVVIVAYTRDSDYHYGSYRHSDYLPRVVSVGEEQAESFKTTLLTEMEARFMALQKDYDELQRSHQSQAYKIHKYQEMTKLLLKEVKESFFTWGINTKGYEKLLSR